LEAQGKLHRDLLVRPDLPTQCDLRSWRDIKVAAVADTPKVMTEGNWRLGVFIGMFLPVASDLTIAEAKRSRINAFGIEYEGKTGLSMSDLSWAV
jgi:hypothetical protein